MVKKRIVVVAFMALGLVGCVSMKSYRQTKANMLHLEVEKRELLRKYEALNDEFKKLAIQYERLQADTTKIKR